MQTAVDADIEDVLGIISGIAFFSFPLCKSLQSLGSTPPVDLWMVITLTWPQTVVVLDRLLTAVTSTLTSPWINHQEVNVVLVFGLKGFCNDPGGFFVLSTPHGNTVDLQDDVTHFQLPTVISRASFLSTETLGGRIKTMWSSHSLFNSVYLPPRKKHWTELNSLGML